MSLWRDLSLYRSCRENSSQVAPDPTQQAKATARALSSTTPTLPQSPGSLRSLRPGLIPRPTPPFGCPPNKDVVRFRVTGQRRPIPPGPTSKAGTTTATLLKELSPWSSTEDANLRRLTLYPCNRSFRRHSLHVPSPTRANVDYAGCDGGDDEIGRKEFDTQRARVFKINVEICKSG